MNNMITDDINVVYYVVKVNGTTVTSRFSDRMMAEMAMNSLSSEQKMLAEVVQETVDGKQILLG